MTEGSSAHETQGAMVEVVRVPMRDGTLLATDIYHHGDEPHPVILERTPYGRRASRGSDQDRHGAEIPQPAEIADFFVRHGYVVVRQDCRGRGDSQGKFVKYLNEGPDGADTVEWIARQPWCDGRVAMMGVSYSAHAQAAAAALDPGGLAALFLDSGGFSSAYEAGIRMGGAFELKQLTWAFAHAKESPEAVGDPTLAAGLDTIDLAGWLRVLPWRRGDSPLRFLPQYEEYLLEQWDNDAFGAYWKQSAIYSRGSYEHFPDIPSMHIGSWYDPYVKSTIENYSTLKRIKSSSAYLVLGPWTHGARTTTFAGDADFGRDAAFDIGLGRSYLEFRRAWLDTQLQGGDDYFPDVTYFLMGGGSGRKSAEGRIDHGGRWQVDQTWPPTGSEVTTFHLGVDGVLEPTLQTTGSSASYDFDPDRPVPTMGGQVTSGEPVMVGGGFDQVPDGRFFGAESPYLPLSARRDVLTFRSKPLASATSVAGAVRAHLWVASDAVDTDFTIKLIDEYPPSPDYPNGFALNLTDGILRCRFRDSFEQATLMDPGSVYEIEIVAPDTANAFAAGHRIRVDISSSNFPRFDVNPNTGAPGAGSRTRTIARNTVFFGGTTPSTLKLMTIGPVNG